MVQMSMTKSLRLPVQTLIASLSRVSKVLPTHGVMRAKASTLVSLKESLRAPAAASCIAKDHTGS